MLCLVSGGADSTCLFHALRELGYRVSALHVDHGLRGSESDADAAWCAERFDAEVVLAAARCSTEAELRDVRYSFRADCLRATGHTLSDQVETILYRLASSPSRRALLGMRPLDGRLARPLLGTTRAETTDYCERRGLAWRDDRSNAEPVYARNRIRSGLLPELAKAHPAASANVLRTAELLRDEAEVLDALVAAEVDGSGDSARGTISLERLQQLHPALRRLVVQQIADAAAGRPVPGAARYAEQVLGLRRTGIAMLDLGGGVRAVVERGVLRAERP